jgi:predicted ArsR family transcriptional regulator
MRVTFTVAEVADKLKVERETARGLIRFLNEIGLAKCRGERAPANGRGAAQKTYQFEDGYEKALVSLLNRAKLTG